MKVFLFYFFIFLLAILIGLVMRLDPGYVLIAYCHWTIEMSLWIALFVLCFLFILLYKAISLSSAWHHFSKFWKLKRQLKHLQEPYIKLQKCLFLLINKDWNKAEKMLLSAVPKNSTAATYYLIAAITASKQGHPEQRDTYIQKAQDMAPHDLIEIGLVHVHLMQEEKQQKQSLLKLKQLQQIRPTHAGVLRQLKEVYFQLHDWQNLLDLLPTLVKHRIIAEEEQVVITETCYSNLFLTCHDDLARLKMLWSEISRPFQKNPNIVLYYCQTLLKLQQATDALRVLTVFLSKRWDEKLIELYGQITSSDPDKQIRMAQKWLKDHDQSAALLLALGKLAIRLKHWREAEDYLSASLSIQENRETFLTLSYLYMMMGETEKAETLFKKLGVN